MTDRTQAHSLQVATELHRFINEQVLPGTGVAPEAFWKGFDEIVNDLAPAMLPCWPNATACRPSWTPGTRPIPAPSPTWPATSSS